MNDQGIGLRGVGHWGSIRRERGVSRGEAMGLCTQNTAAHASDSTAEPEAAEGDCPAFTGQADADLCQLSACTEEKDLTGSTKVFLL